MFRLLRSLAFSPVGKLWKSFNRMEWNRTSFSHTGILKTDKKKVLTFVFLRMWKFLAFVTYALPLVAMSEMPCGYRNSRPPLLDINAEGDSTDFFLQIRKLEPK